MHDLRLVHTVREPDVWLFKAALEVQRGLVAEGIEFCFIGGVALQRWGEVRFTTDVDLTAWCPLGDEQKTADKLKRLFPARHTDIDIDNVAKLSRMYLGIGPTGHRVDISMGWIPYERRLMDRSVDIDFGIEEPLRCCSAEDLAILKTVAGRGQDWVDLKRIIQRSGRSMNWDLVWTELKVLLDLVEEPESLDRLRELVERER